MNYTQIKQLSLIYINNVYSVVHVLNLNDITYNMRLDEYLNSNYNTL